MVNPNHLYLLNWAYLWVELYQNSRIHWFMSWVDCWGGQVIVDWLRVEGLIWRCWNRFVALLEVPDLKKKIVFLEESHEQYNTNLILQRTWNLLVCIFFFQNSMTSHYWLWWFEFLSSTITKHCFLSLEFSRFFFNVLIINIVFSA